jgi:hypothetical protein
VIVNPIHVYRHVLRAIGKIRSLWLVALFATAAVLAGCDSVAQYSGDGKLIDSGPSAATDRYVLDLGPVSLKGESSAKFRLVNLPKVDFVIGIELKVAGMPASSLEKSSINPTVSIKLVGPDGKTVVAKQGKLTEWTWSVQTPGNHAFVYGRETPGTHFTPDPRAQYELTLNVREADRSGTDYTARLVAKSGGWK